MRSINPHWSGDRIYQETRKIVGARMQIITYEEWLPKILGPRGMAMLGQYTGYNDEVNPTISNEFATAAFRFGHTLVPPILYRLDSQWNPIIQGHLELHKAFFAPDRMLKDGGLDPILRGLLYHGVRQNARQPPLNPELTEKLFAMAHELALDLAALNVQRGRDHGFPSYTAYAHSVCKLLPQKYPDSFEDLSDLISSADLREKLRQVYGHPGNIDLFVGGILEDLLPEARVGPTFGCIIADQFKRLRAGDRFWYEADGVFSVAQRAELKRAGGYLSRVICDNADNMTEITKDAFMRPMRGKKDMVMCSSLKLPRLNLAYWKYCPNADISGDDSYSFESRFASENGTPVNNVRRRRSVPDTPPPSCEQGSCNNEENDQLPQLLRRISTLEKRLHQLQSELQNRAAGD
ncbi:hypothetical protein Ciccas_007344 [Cichlidogyrus casuarinus]|uniref:Peroxidasin n=1 Tax=Cichlidogyrus casuarinus TaxID=1844966 RepID=A0ABD2Q4B1_9PLAT